jgi:hypothetical protein
VDHDDGIIAFVIDVGDHFLDENLGDPLLELLIAARGDPSHRRELARHA